MRRDIALGAAMALCAAAMASISLAQAPPPDPVPLGGGVRPVVYPPRATDPAAVARGQVLYTQNGCAGCHGADIRGGSAPALHRSKIVLDDVRGELLGPFLAKGRPGAPNHAFNFEKAQAIDIADFLHSTHVTGTGSGGVIRRAASILVGSADAGKAYFAKNCAACHSATGDLAGIGTRVADPRNLQQRWLGPGSTKPVTAVVAAKGGPVTGQVTAIDEFSITLKTPAGERVIERNGDKPRITLNDPLAGHAALLRRITDKDIHDVTAYLVTLK